MAGDLVDPLSAAGIAQQAVVRSLAAQRGAEGSATAADASAKVAAAAAADAKAAQAAFGVTPRWSGSYRTVFSVRQPDGTWSAGVDLQGLPGGPGPAPDIRVGNVTEGDFAVVRQPGSPDEAPVFDFTLKRGLAAWTPLPAFVADGARRVMQIVDWSGGQGTKPTTGFYVGPAGLVPDLASAVDLRGSSDSIAVAGTPTPGHLALWDSSSALRDGGALTTVGASLVSAQTAAAAKAVLSISITDVAGAAPSASPSLTGIPTAPTAPLGTNTTQIATMAAIQAAIAGLINSAPGALDTIKELADAIGDDPNYATTVTNALASKLAKAANLSDVVDKAVARTNLGLAIGTNVQAWDADLDAIATLTTTVFGRSFLTFGTAATAKAALAIASTDIGDASTTGRSVMTAASVAALKTILAIATGDVSGLGNAAIRNVGTTSGTVAAGDDSRFSAAGAFPATFASKSASYTVLASDAGTQFTLTSSGTLTLPSAASMGAGKGIWLRKVDNVGSWTIAGTIDGLSSLQMYSEGSYAIVSNGTAWVTQGRPKGVEVNLGTITIASAQASATFTAGLTDPELRDLHIEAVNVVPSGSDYLALRVAKGGAYLSTGYSGEALTETGTANNSTTTNASLTAIAANSTTASFADIKVFTFAAATPQQILIVGGNLGSSAGVGFGAQTGMTGAITGVQLFFANGANINSGTFNVKAFRP